MGSYASSITKDQRVAIDGNLDQLTSPQSQIANPLGLSIGASDRSSIKDLSVSYGDVRYNDLDAVNELVTSIMQQQTDTLKSINKLGTDVISQVSTAATEIKEPLTKFIPYIGGGILLILLLKMAK